MKTIYTMQLHDVIELHTHNIVRVPDGWIYTYYGSATQSSVFVPYNGEFNTYTDARRETAIEFAEFLKRGMWDLDKDTHQWYNTYNPNAADKLRTGAQVYELFIQNPNDTKIYSADERQN